MSNRKLVIDLVQIPADTPLAEIARQIELRAGIETARPHAGRCEGQPVERFRQQIDSWAAPSPDAAGH